MAETPFTIAVASGKGGTGKTLISTNIAAAEAGRCSVALVDCDVEAPDAGLFFDLEPVETIEATAMLARVIPQYCIRCGRCSQACAYGAIRVLGSAAVVFEELCHGCGVYSDACEYLAIEERQQRIDAQKIGKGAEKFSMDVKGVGIPMHEPRLKHALGVGYMINPHGADHMCNMHDTFVSFEGRSLEELQPLLGMIEPLPTDDVGPLKIALLRVFQLSRIVRDCLLLCIFVPYSHVQVAEITAAVTGWDTGMMELIRVGERIMTMLRLINIREGLTAEDDKLPDRFFQSKSGALEGKYLDCEKMEKAKRYYYTLMGWDSETGVPTKEKIEELQID